MDETKTTGKGKARKTGKWLLMAAVAVGCLFFLIIASWITVEATVEITSHADFCGMCHSMEPMVESYQLSTHGGNNRVGVTAPCTDCHVSHKSLPDHLWGKAKSGTHDFWVEYINPRQIDWDQKRERREEYVYDSGCLTCHRNVETATVDDPNAFIAHKPYFLGETDKQCVSCHKHVGHKDLSLMIAEHETRGE